MACWLWKDINEILFDLRKTSNWSKNYENRMISKGRPSKYQVYVKILEESKGEGEGKIHKNSG